MSKTPKFLLMAALAALAGCATSTPKSQAADSTQSNCVTGTRIKGAVRQCGPGQVITKEELDQGGDVDTGSALRRQSPYVR